MYSVARSFVLVSSILAVAIPALAAALDCPPARDLWPAGAEDAEARARACVEEAPGDPERMLALSLILGWQGRYEEALAGADAALALDPAHLDIAAWRMRLLGWLGRHDEAQAALDALDLAAVAAAQAADAERSDDAEGSGREAAGLDPLQHPGLLLVRGDLALRRNDLAAADAAYSSYLEQWPEDQGIRLSLATIRLRLGDEAAARPMIEALCTEEFAPACRIQNELDRSGLTLRLQGGPIVSSGEGSGWRGRIGLEAPVGERLQLRGGVEMQQRSYGGEALRDPIVDLAATYLLSPRLSLDVGAGVAIDPSFSPDWNAHMEAGFGLGAGFTLYAKYWRIEFPGAGVDVLSPALTYQGRSFWLSARLWRSFDPAAKDGLAVLGQGGFPLVRNLDLTLGVGGGDKADYLILRDVAMGAQRHLVGLAGLSWSPSYEYQLRVDYVGRREWIDDDRLLRHELLFGVARRW